MACKGHANSWSVPLLRVYKLEILSFSLDILSSPTQNIGFLDIAWSPSTLLKNVTRVMADEIFDYTTHSDTTQLTRSHDITTV